MMEQVVLVNVQGENKQEFVDAFKEAVFETMMLLFERRTLQLEESSLFALYLLAQVAKNMQVCTRDVRPFNPSSKPNPQPHGH